MAYENEDHNSTTLVSGKVRVLLPGGGRSVDVEPGRQAIVDGETHALRVADANVEQVIAWKNGLFRFHETGIRELMRQVERWYNVQVVYQTAGSDQDFTGVVSRSKNIGELLHTLEMTGTVHFRIEGRKVMVLP
jgi:ferric-dicitrate binding protein FerR (iron transport regulator)